VAEREDGKREKPASGPQGLKPSEDEETDDWVMLGAQGRNVDLAAATP